MAAAASGSVWPAGLADRLIDETQVHALALTRVARI
jgi:hypothetical protein